MRKLAVSRVFDHLCAAGTGEGVIAIERPGLGVATIMVRRGKSSEIAPAIKQHWDIDLVDGPVKSGIGRTSFIGTGNGRWLAVLETPPANFIAELQTRLKDVASVIDQSHAFGVLRLSGPGLLSTLEKGVQIDLAPDIFKVGCAAVTNIAHLGVNLWKVDDAPIFDFAIPRSLAGSFCHWLEVSAAVHGLAVHRSPL